MLLNGKNIQIGIMLCAKSTYIREKEKLYLLYIGLPYAPSFNLHRFKHSVSRWQKFLRFKFWKKIGIRKHQTRDCVIELLWPQNNTVHPRLSLKLQKRCIDLIHMTCTIHLFTKLMIQFRSVNSLFCLSYHKNAM